MISAYYRSGRMVTAAFSLIELLVTLVVIAILTLISFGLIDNTRDSAKMSKNMANLRALGIASHSYAVAHNGRMPISSSDAAGDKVLLSSGYNASKYSAPRRLLSSDYPGGSGSESFVESADVFYSPFVTAFSERLPGRFHSPSGLNDTVGPFKIGYIFYSFPSVPDSRDTPREPMAHQIWNDRLENEMANQRTPLYTDVLDLPTNSNVADTGFIGKKCMVVHLDGSVSVFDQSQIRQAGNFTAAMYLIAGVKLKR